MHSEKTFTEKNLQILKQSGGGAAEEEAALWAQVNSGSLRQHGCGGMGVALAMMLVILSRGFLQTL